jgi:hypothetical protein
MCGTREKITPVVLSEKISIKDLRQQIQPIIRQSLDYNALVKRFSFSFLLQYIAKHRLNENSVHIDSLDKIANFYNIALPSTLITFIFPSDPKKLRWLCLFDDCLRLKPQSRSFANKQTLLRHILIKHDLVLPGGGLFLTPKSNYFKQGGFFCSTCCSHFCRMDHYEKHKSSKKHRAFLNTEPRDIDRAIKDTLPSSSGIQKDPQVCSNQKDIHSDDLPVASKDEFILIDLTDDQDDDLPFI